MIKKPLKTQARSLSDAQVPSKKIVFGTDLQRFGEAPIFTVWSAYCLSGFSLQHTEAYGNTLHLSAPHFTTLHHTAQV